MRPGDWKLSFDDGLLSPSSNDGRAVAVDDAMMFAAIMRQPISPWLNLDIILLLIVAVANINNVAANASGYCGIIRRLLRRGCPRWWWWWRRWRQAARLSNLQAAVGADGDFSGLIQGSYAWATTVVIVLVVVVRVAAEVHAIPFRIVDHDE